MKTEYQLKQIRVTGVVQGVGFRPFVWQLAQQQGLSGWVLNDGKGVLILMKVPCSETLAAFVQALKFQAPPLATVCDVLVSDVSLKPVHDRLMSQRGFEILASEAGTMQTSVLPDAATCESCLAEIQDSKNRRYGYAFTNCTHCGPRYSIIEKMPYDRKQTTMADFEMCPTCYQEYHNPADRRFHAQPNGCPECGPQLTLFQAEDGKNWRAVSDETSSFVLLPQVVQALKAGQIVAIKGVGGIHLVCDPCHPQAVSRLRERKHRPHKPFALMAKDMAVASEIADVSILGQQWLQDVSGTIVLLPKKSSTATANIVRDVAPDQSAWGVMLPSNPLHHLLMHHWQEATGRGVLLMTSANLSGHPQLYKDVTSHSETHENLLALADWFLGHNRRIIRRLEDSVMAIWPNGQRGQRLRVARGFAPMCLTKPAGFESQSGWLATGADLKNAMVIDSAEQLVLSQYLGDMADWITQQAQQQTWLDFQALYEFKVQGLATDAHPNYVIHQWAAEQAMQLQIALHPLAHHHAHLASVLFSQGVPRSNPPVLGIIWDGLGYGQADDALWGGEFLWADYRHCERLSYFEALPLVGGDLANQEPWRNAYVQIRRLKDWHILCEDYADLNIIQYLKTKPLALIEGALKQRINTPYSSSVGRLFDAMAALCGVCMERQSYEGEAAMRLTALVTEQSLRQTENTAYIFNTTSQGISAQSVFGQALQDLSQSVAVSVVASRFIWALVNIAETQVQHLAKQHLFNRVVLSGGVFQNGWLSQLLDQRLSSRFKVLHSETVPANDQGIAVGQWALASDKS